MTSRNVVVPEAMTAIAMAVVASSPPKLPYLPPRGGGASAAAAICRPKYHSPIELGGAWSSGWAESMRSSSPTHAKAAVVESEQDEHSAWIVQHPSALRRFEPITNASKGKQIVLFLDYDGTLSPIVDDPDSAFMSETTRAAVKEAARCFPTAIVSGRCRSKVYDFVKLTELYYAGSHGMDIEVPKRTPHSHEVEKSNAPSGSQKKKPHLFQPAREFLPMMSEVHKTLSETTRSIPGAKVENNKFCVSVHFRCVDEKQWGLLVEQVRLVLKQYPELRITQGRMVLEIRPAIKWDKGKALEFLLEYLGFADCKNVMPVYIGDDRTDEDAFKMLRDRGQGIGILVSKFPKETDASYSLREPSEVRDFLLRLVEWKRMHLQQRNDERSYV